SVASHARVGSDSGFPMSTRGSVGPSSHCMSHITIMRAWLRQACRLLAFERAGELAEDPVRQLGPGLRRPLVELPVGQAGTGQAGVRVDPQEGTRTPEVPERPG